MGEIELHTGSLTDLYMIDFQKGLTSQLINIIDERIDKLYDLIENSHIDDERIESIESIFESIEHIVGLGFVVLQQYITVVRGDFKKDKKNALSKEPKHESGNTFAKIVDASADYWKHNGEWRLDTDRNRKGKEDIEAIFETISINSPVSVNDYYPLVKILSELSHTKNRRFNAVFKKILEWRDELSR